MRVWTVTTSDAGGVYVVIHKNWKEVEEDAVAWLASHWPDHFGPMPDWHEAWLVVSQQSTDWMQIDEHELA